MASVWVCLAEGGGVEKRVTVPGVGEGTPKEGAKCFVHYRVFLEETGEEVYATEENDGPPVEVVASAGAPGCSSTAGLGIGLLSMRKRERAELRVRPEYGYGEEGSFSFPHVPPSSTLVYSADLLGWLEEGEESLTTDMLFEERLAAAQRRRDLGVDEFRCGNYREAWSFFNMGISFLNEDMMFQLKQEDLGKVHSIRHPLLLNSFSSLVRLKRYGQGLKLAEQVTREDPENAKAWCRVAKGHRLLGNTGRALEAIRAAEGLAPGSEAVREELERIREAESAGKERDKKRWFGMFG
ncbi:FKBP-type peptidyl-prolyl cis-trans isomerase [Chloropicon primus]|uniref:peptidylprolyl isomerase n=1 Tax=Chloropicon primus TaxID=1764295 RepID=A0A5B8MKG6_9CHLO|nr:FKBP-type peptidyl-prolyl cis-trans isomerase [Chloropicon primus]|eukprot:QDZ19862.1 FKBP-type peptidyl-prolyl cis-trans isomerase [Chloropicon primus]